MFKVAKPDTRASDRIIPVKLCPYVISALALFGVFSFPAQSSADWLGLTPNACLEIEKEARPLVDIVAEEFTLFLQTGDKERFDDFRYYWRGVARDLLFRANREGCIDTSGDPLGVKVKDGNYEIVNLYYMSISPTMNEDATTLAAGPRILPGITRPSKELGKGLKSAEAPAMK